MQSILGREGPVSIVAFVEHVNEGFQRGVGDAPQRLCEDTFEDGAGRVLGWGACKVVMRCSESSDRGINGVSEDVAGPEVGNVAEDDEDVGQVFAES